jgi:hypothetical protein
MAHLQSPRKGSDVGFSILTKRLDSHQVWKANMPKESNGKKVLDRSHQSRTKTITIAVFRSRVITCGQLS